MSSATLGIKPTLNLRDAIHVAVVTGRAGEDLPPGTPVKMHFGLAMSCDRNEAVGVVDPFLPGVVKHLQYFLLVLNPGSTTNLRHSWDHPAFPAEDLVDDDDEEYDECRNC